MDDVSPDAAAEPFNPQFAAGRTHALLGIMLALLKTIGPNEKLRQEIEMAHEGVVRRTHAEPVQDVYLIAIEEVFADALRMIAGSEAQRPASPHIPPREDQPP